MPLAAEGSDSLAHVVPSLSIFSSKIPCNCMGISQMISEQQDIRVQYCEWKLSSPAHKEGPANQSNCSFESQYSYLD